MERFLFRMTGYMDSCSSYQDAVAVLVGLPMDMTVSNRPGTRSAPQEIRTISFALEEYSICQEKSLLDINYYDAGDVALPFGNVTESLRRIEEVGKQIFADKKFPLFIGGEHLVTYPLIKACHNYYPDLVVLQFDAHADLRSQYEGEEDSHATVMYKIAQYLGPHRIYQLGIRSGTKDEIDFARKKTHLFINEIFPALHRIIEEVKDQPVYITLDIDVVDPAFAPGTGTPEPGGCTSSQILSAITAMKDLNVVGMDLVEISPLSDSSNVTTILGAKIIREALLAFVKN